MSLLHVFRPWGLDESRTRDEFDLLDRSASRIRRSERLSYASLAAPGYDVRVWVGKSSLVLELWGISHRIAGPRSIPRRWTYHASQTTHVICDMEGTGALLRQDWLVPKRRLTEASSEGTVSRDQIV